MAVTFFGHAKFEYSLEIKQKLKEQIEIMINQGEDKFFLGGYGAFDTLAARTIYDLKKHYPHIESILVIPYLNRNYNLDLYDFSIYPDIENVPKKYAITKRNEWMIKNSISIICHVSYTYGGAYTALKYAKKSNKRIINLSNIIL